MTLEFATSLLVKATGLLLVGLVSDRLLRHRHVLVASAVWNAVLVALLVLPVAALVLPKVNLPLLPANDQAVTTLSPRAAAEDHSIQALQTDFTTADLRPDDRAAAELTEQHAANATNSPVVAATSVVSPARVLALLYCLAVAALLLRLVADWYATVRLRRSAPEVTHPLWLERLEHWRQRFNRPERSADAIRQGRLSEHIQPRFEIRLLESSDVAVPLALGIRHAAIIMPAQTVTSADRQAIDSILVHELAHLYRADTAWQFVQRIVEAALWFHPLVWWARPSISFVRERACDEFSVQALGDGEAYARTLLDIASSLLSRRSLGLGLGLGIVRPTSLARRLALIANSAGSDRCVASRGVRWAAVAVSVALAALSVRFVAAESQGSRDAATTVASPKTPARIDENAAPDPLTAKPRRIRHHAITVTGRALDPEGRPIAGASIFLVSTNSSPNRSLGHATTDHEGLYAFHDAQLPLYASEVEDERESGSFQVFGKAPGRAFAWCGLKFFDVNMPKRRPNGEPIGVPIGPDGRTTFSPGKMIEIDLTISERRSVFGRFFDEKGKPIEGLKVQLAGCNRAPHLDEIDFWAIDQASELMPGEFLATTDVQGSFQFPNVPAEAICWVIVDDPSYGRLSFYTSTMDQPPARHDDGHSVLGLPVQMGLKKARDVTFKVRHGRTQQPIAGVAVHAYTQRASGYASSTVSDRAGTAVLRLPPGKYKVSADPPARMVVDWVRTYTELEVEENGIDQPIRILPLKPGCSLVLRAVDARNGAGIPGIRFWHEQDNQFGSALPVQSSPSIFDYPRTNEDGELYATVVPGKSRYRIEAPAGYILDREDRSGRLLDLPAGEKVVAEFRLRTPNTARPKPKTPIQPVVMLHAESADRGISRTFPAIAFARDPTRTLLISAAWGAIPFPVAHTDGRQGVPVGSIRIMGTSEIANSKATRNRINPLENIRGVGDAVNIVACNEELGVAILSTRKDIPLWPLAQIVDSPLRERTILTEYSLPDDSEQVQHIIQKTDEVYRYRWFADSPEIAVQHVLEVDGKFRGNPGTPLLQEGKLAGMFLNSGGPNATIKYVLPVKRLQESFTELMRKAD